MALTTTSTCFLILFDYLKVVAPEINIDRYKNVLITFSLLDFIKDES